ncbi:MAG: helicase-exonuclease AddAB subunit AddA [Clostridiales bacterium]|nr:helicase-exonuclease AddAB subunit AddA [Clostridiales bacterium]
MDWTASQREAINARNHSVLVSAAAGSGKTAVLLERVTKLLQEGYDLSEMLIITFTRAAASELKAKLMEKLDKSENEELRRQALYVNRADISTIHVFCSRLIRENFQACGIDPLSKIPDDAILASELQKVTDDVLEAAYDHPTPEEEALFTSYTTPQILDMLSSLRRFVNARADGDAWTEKALSENSIDKYVDIMKKDALMLTDLAMGYLEECDKVLDKPGAPLQYEENLQADMELTRNIAQNMKNGIYPAGKIEFQTLSRKKKGDFDPALADKYKELREKFKKTLNRLSSYFPEDMRQAQEDIDFTLPSLRALVELNRRVEDSYTKLKRRKNQLDFGDLEHLALKTLENDSVRHQVHMQYRAVFVDEYQDVSALQEALIEKITGENTLLFMVGDVKQSIYGFRLADPSLFRTKYENFSDDKGAYERRIVLQQNFRSTANILSCVNAVFSHAMRKNVTELDYDEKAMLYPADNADRGAETELVIIKGAPGDEDDETNAKLPRGYEHEAVFVAERISELIRTGRKKDKNGNMVPLQYRDIVILMRNVSGRAPVIAKILAERGIPVFSDASEQFYDLPEVSDILSILQVLSNPYQDIPLIATLHSPCFGFTETELAALKLTNLKSRQPYHRIFYDAVALNDPLGRKVSDCIQTLDRWRFLSRHMTVSNLIRLIMDETGLYTRAGTLRDGELRQADMRLLCDRADGLTDPYDLNEFLQLIRIARGSDDKSGAKAIGENENVVRIMTIHKSKGLEFPVVFIMEMARKFMPDTQLLQLDSETGMALSYIDGDLRIKKETFATKCLKMQKDRRSRAEECRLLYVAMTRAKEKLILVCSPGDLSAHMNLWNRPRKDFAAGDAHQMSDWVGQTLQEGICLNDDRLFTDEKGSIWKITWRSAQEENVHILCQDGASGEDETAISEDTVYWMNRKAVKGDVLKTSVTSVSKKIKSEDDMEETPVKKRKPRQNMSCPAFMEPNKDITPAEKGTAAHKALGCIDYNDVREGRLEDGIRTLLKKELLTKREFDSIQIQMLADFFRSETGAGALASKTVHREWQFVIRLENNSILQGVIDLCYLQDGKWVLVDYKTDHTDEKELLKRYSLQINWYRTALEKITSIPVAKTVIYSLALGKEIPVDPVDPSLPEKE